MKTGIKRTWTIFGKSFENYREALAHRRAHLNDNLRDDLVRFFDVALRDGWSSENITKHFVKRYEITFRPQKRVKTEEKS